MLIGLPRMHKEPGELRDFLPGFVAYLAEHDVAGIVVEDGYGSGMGYRVDNYLRSSVKVKVGTYEDCLAQDVVVVLRSPDEAALRLMRRGAIAVAMFHYPTNIWRSRLLVELGIHGVSLDSIVDDRGRRVIENMGAVAWNGMEAAFRELAHSHAHFEDPRRPPIRVTVLGSGAVAGAVCFAATRYGDQDLRSRMIAHGIAGAEVTVIDYDLTCDEDYMLGRLARTDILVDATRRPDPKQIVIPNKWLAVAPEHAVILDLAADVYDFTATPPMVKAIEGIPHGNLDRYRFSIDDPAYEELTAHLQTANRRVALSCYSWPGIHPRDSMEHYGAQLEPVFEVIAAKAPERWDVSSDNHMERAIARAEVTRWLHTADLSH